MYGAAASYLVTYVRRSGKSGVVHLDTNNDRIADYRMWHLPVGASAYDRLLDIHMIDNMNGVSACIPL